eukprot:g8366.t1
MRAGAFNVAWRKAIAVFALVCAPLLLWQVPVQAAKKGGNKKPVEIPTDLSDYDQNMLAQLQRVITARARELMAEQAGATLLEDCDNSPLGQITWSALKIEDMICIISSVGQLRASTVRKYLKNSLQFSWLLEKVGIRGDWSVPKKAGGTRRSVQTAARWLANEVQPMEMAQAWSMMPTGEALLQISSDQHQAHQMDLQRSFQQHSLVGHPMMQHQNPGYPALPPHTMPALMNNTWRPTPGGSASWQHPPSMPTTSASSAPPTTIPFGAQQTSLFHASATLGATHSLHAHGPAMPMPPPQPAMPAQAPPAKPEPKTPGSYYAVATPRDNSSEEGEEEEDEEDEESGPEFDILDLPNPKPKGKAARSYQYKCVNPVRSSAKPSPKASPKAKGKAASKSKAKAKPASPSPKGPPMKKAKK